MGSRKSSAPAPVAQSTPQVQTPDVDVAQTAAMKALAAQGDVRGAQAAEEEQQSKPTGALAQAAATQPPAAAPKRKRPERDPAAYATSARGGTLTSSAVLTG